MASEIVTGCLNGVDGRDFADALSSVLARFDEDSDDSRWESQWRVHGDDGLPLPAYRATDVRVLMVDGRCAGAPRGLLDLDGAWAAAAAEAGRRWDAWQEFSAAYPKARSLEGFYTESAADPVRYDLLQAAVDYRAQPVVMSSPFLADGRVPGSEPPSLEQDPVGWFGLDRGEYAERCAARLLPTAGLLTLNGEWLDPDQLLHGSSAAEKMINDFRDRLAYYAYVDAYLRALPPETFVVRVKVRT